MNQYSILITNTQPDKQKFPIGSRIEAMGIGPVESLDFDPVHQALAVAIGSEVILCKQADSGQQLHSELCNTVAVALTILSESLRTCQLPHPPPTRICDGWTSSVLARGSQSIGRSTKSGLTDCCEVCPCSLHYVEHGRAIIVSYIYHGIMFVTTHVNIYIYLY